MELVHIEAVMYIFVSGCKLQVDLGLQQQCILSGRVVGSQTELQDFKQDLRPSRRVLGPQQNYRLSESAEIT